MGRGSRQDQALSSVAPRRAVDSNSFQGVGKVLDELYTPLGRDHNAEQMFERLSEGPAMSDTRNELIDHLEANCVQLRDAKEMIFEALVPSLPRAAALQATVLGRSIDKNLTPLAETSMFNSGSKISEAHFDSPRFWSESKMESFFKAQDDYQQLREIIESFDDEKVEQRRKAEIKDRLEQKRRFEGTAASISGHE